MIGTALQNRYRIDAELGRGGMGVVYRAHDTLLDGARARELLQESLKLLEEMSVPKYAARVRERLESLKR